MKSRISRFFQMLFAEKHLLLLCFVLAFLAWQSIRRNISFKLPVSNIAVEIEVPQGWAVWDKSVSHVKVFFTGSKEDIRSLNSDQLLVVVPVEIPQEEGNPVQVRFSEKHLRDNPTSARVLSFSPEVIVVELDREAEKEFPTKAALIGSLPEGLEISRIVCTPATAKVRGAQRRLAEMENVRTAPIDLAEQQRSFKMTLPLALPAGGKLKSDVEFVSIECELVQRNRDGELGEVPVRVLSRSGALRRITIQPETVNVVVRGRTQRVEQLLKADIAIYVDCTELSDAAVYMLPVQADLPEGLQLVRTDPAVVQAEIINLKQEL